MGKIQTPLGEGLVTTEVKEGMYVQTLDINGSGVKKEGKVGAGRSHHEWSYYGPRKEECEECDLVAYLEVEE